MERVLRQRGFTFLEVCLGGTLGLILGLVLLWALIPVLRYSSWGYARAEVVQATALVSSRIVADLQAAPLEAITRTPDLLGIHGIVGVTDTGVAIWSDHLVLYRWDQPHASLSRMEWSNDVAINAPTVFSLAQLRNCFQSPNRSLHRLANGILREFSLTGTSLPLQLHLKFVVPVPGGRAPESYVHEQEITLRNGSR